MIPLVVAYFLLLTLVLLTDPFHKAPGRNLARVALDRYRHTRRKA